MTKTVEDRLLVRMETTLRKFEREMDRGRRVSISTAESSQKAWKTAGSQIAANANRAASGIGRLSKVSGAGRFVLQNTANQIGDIAVQLEGGTNAFRVMGQQLPQILGGFGALGGVLGVLAPLLGTVAAVGLPIAAMLMAVGDEGEETAEKVKSFSDRLSEAEGALGRAQKALKSASRGGAEDLANVYGVITEKVRDLSMALLDIEVRAAQLSVDRLLDDALGDDYRKQVEDMFGTVGAALVSSASDQAKVEAEQIRDLISQIQSEIDVITSTGQPAPPQLSAEIVALNEELAAVEGRFADIGSLSEELKVDPAVLSSYRELEDSLAAARSEGDFAAVADTLSEMRAILEGMGDIIAQGVKDELTQAEAEARALANTMGEAEEAASDTVTAASGISGAISPAVSEAQALAKWLNISLASARRIAAMGPQGVPGPGDENGLVYSGRGGDPTKQGGSLLDYNTIEATEFLNNYRAPSRSRSSSRGGGSRRTSEKPLFEDVEKQLRNLEREIEMIGKTEAEVAELTARYRLLDEAKKRGIDLDSKQAGSSRTVREQIDEQAAAVGRLTQKADEYKERAQFMDGLNQDLKDGFIDAIIEGENFGDVLENVAKQLAKAALQAALFNTGPFASMGGGGLLGGLFGGLFGGSKAPSYAGGGFTGMGSRSGGVDGKGGFPAILHPNETVVDHTKGQHNTRGETVVRVDLSPELVGQVVATADRNARVMVASSAAAQQRGLNGAMQGARARGTTG